MTNALDVRGVAAIPRRRASYAEFVRFKCCSCFLCWPYSCTLKLARQAVSWSILDMPTSPKRPSLARHDGEISLAKAERLLRSMHKVFSHDLPNQMVVLQSLLQLLRQEEAQNLTDDGREYVRRLQNA